MAKCDQGYLCEVCGEEVHAITDSDLYLRYVLGEVASRDLLAAPERHLACNPTTAQFIRDDRFDAPTVDGPFGRDQLDADFVAAEDARVTGGYRRLREVVRLGLPVAEYPLPSATSSD